MAAVSQAPSATAEGWHAQYSPSKSEQWMNCPGSIAASIDLPAGPSSTFADEGTAAHLLASRAFDYKKDAAFWIGEDIQVNNNLFPVTAEMAAFVQVYIDEMRRRTLPGDTAMHEQRVYFSDIVRVADQGGTADFIILHAGCKRVTIADLKYGMGVEVSAVENKQMMTYAAAVVFETFDMLMSEVEEITMLICQPRISDAPSEWTCTRAQLAEHADNMEAAVTAAEMAIRCKKAGEPLPPSLFQVTQKGFRWCPVKPTCDHYRQFVANEVMGDFKALDTPESVAVLGVPQVPGAPSKLGYLYGILDMIDGWTKAVRGEVERLVLAGTQVVGPDGLPMKIVEGKKGNRAWSDEEAAAATLMTVLGPDDAYKPPQVISPADAEKKLGKKRKAEYEDFIKPLVTQSPGKPSVVLGSDPRPPYVAEASTDEFQDLGGAE